MQYKNDIARLALLRLGVAQNGSGWSLMDFTTENTPQARIIRQQFRDTLDYCLEYHGWDFAKKFASPALLVAAPSSGRLYAYTFPADALVIRRVGPNVIIDQDYDEYPDDKYTWDEPLVGGGLQIHTNVPDARVMYTQRLSEDSVFPSHFARAMAAQLALDIAPSLITANFPAVQSKLSKGASDSLTAGVAFDMGRRPAPKNPAPPFYSARYR